MKENIISDLFFYAIPTSLIVLFIGLYFSVFEIVIIAGFVLALLLIVLTGFAANDLGWIKEKPVRSSPKQVVNVFMQRPDIPRRYAPVSSYDEYDDEYEEDEELDEEEDDPFADLDIIDNYGFLDGCQRKVI